MDQTLNADLCVVGGGPAGLTLGLELARRGRRVVVLEKSEEFDRSFRGESILPDSVWLLDRLGVLPALRAEAIEGHRLQIADAGTVVLDVKFTEFGQPLPYPLEIPQPTMLRALAETAGAHPGFTLVRSTAVTGLITAAGRIVGVRATGATGQLEVRAPLTVAADGRYSKLRDLAGIAYDKQPLRRDVLWFKMSYPSVWEPNVYRVRIDGDRHAIFLPTCPDLVRVGFNIPKGGLKELRSQGINALYARVDALAPELSQNVRTEIRSWSDTMMLDIFTTTVPKWSRPGIVLVGDAAHTLSPILGHGVNHAIMDAVALAPMIDYALGDRDQDDALDEAAIRFQRERTPAIGAARRLQLRQEKLFTVRSSLGTALRRRMYQMIDRSAFLKRVVLKRAYYTIRQSGAPAPLPTRAEGAAP